MSNYDALNQSLDKLCTGLPLPAEEWPDNIDQGVFNLELGPDGLAFSSVPDLLEAEQIQAELPHLTVEVIRAIDSTNTYLMQLPGTRANRLCTTEIQLAGRGRRGRQWSSPFARNLAISMGFASRLPLSQLGGLSLICGLALIDVFQALGIRHVGLKWPNDVLIDGAKISGILVELITVGTETEVVIGFGVNVDLQDYEIDQIDQPVTDLRRQGVTLSRTELLVMFASSLHKYVSHFEEHGFARFVSAFNSVHVFHQQHCRLVSGNQTITGLVIGVDEAGGLQVRVDDEVRTFHGGEVSLRQSSL